ncbi:MAG: ABC transporter substrate-binding protein [Eubacterium sp.]|nr:ABC transporter substrate-binding protein [Eubacterium sp.]
MKKKLMSLILAASMMGALLAGCGSGGSTQQENDNAEASGAGEGTAAQDGEEVYTVAIQLVNVTTDQTDIEMVEEEINKITEPAIHCKVDIQNIFIGDLPTTTSMNVVSDEKMDIICVGLTQKVSDIADDGILMELDDYLQYAPAYTELVKDYMKAGKVNGIQYALPVHPYLARSAGFVYNKDMADKYNIVLEDGASFDDLAKAFEVLKQNGIYGTSSGQASSSLAQNFYNIELYGTNGDYGMIKDPANSTKIESWYGSDYFKEFCHAMKDWAEAGYIPADSLTDTTTVQEYMTMEKVFGTATAYDMSEYATWQAGQPFQIDIVQLEDQIVTTSSVVERMWGLAATCKNPKKAMEFLNYMYENPAVANLLRYGMEGQHYLIVEGTEHVVTPDGSTSGSKGYASQFTHFGNPVETLTAAPNTDRYAEDVKAFNAEVPVSATLGYSFDASEYSAEAGAVSNVIAEYLPRLQTGQVEDVDTSIEEFVKALDSAGYQDIIEGNQKQLDVYLSAE